jgi:hypothetical protein
MRLTIVGEDFSGFNLFDLSNRTTFTDQMRLSLILHGLVLICSREEWRDESEAAAFVRLLLCDDDLFRAQDPWALFMHKLPQLIRCGVVFVEGYRPQAREEGIRGQN